MSQLVLAPPVIVEHGCSWACLACDAVAAVGLRPHRIGALVLVVGQHEVELDVHLTLWTTSKMLWQPCAFFYMGSTDGSLVKAASSSAHSEIPDDSSPRGGLRLPLRLRASKVGGRPND